MKKSTIIVKVLHALLVSEQQREAVTNELMACEDELSDTLHALMSANKQLTQPRDDGFERVTAAEYANAKERIKQLKAIIRQMGGRVADTEIDTRKDSPCDMGGCD